MSELEAADRHIATAGGEAPQAKETKRELKQLKQEKQALRKSPERKIGQVLLAPYRLPQKLVREVRKRFPDARPRGGSGPASEYQEWLEAHRVEERADRVTPRRGARVCLPAVHQHHHAGLQHSGGLADRVRRIGPESDLRKMGAHSGRRRFDQPRNSEPAPGTGGPRRAHCPGQRRGKRRDFSRVQLRALDGEGRLGGLSRSR